MADSPAWLGQPAREAFPQLAGQGYFELLDQVFQTGERRVMYASPARFRERPGDNEREYFLDFIYAPVFDEEGQVVGIFCEGQDVTETHLARRVLAEEDRRKTEFLATLAHELRNPLATLRSGVVNLRGAGSDPAILANIGWTMERQTTLLTRLVDDLLDVSRINVGKLEMRVERLDLRSVLFHAIETSAPWLGASGQVLDTDVPSAAVPVDGDAVRLAQAVCNLLHNASKFSPLAASPSDREPRRQSVTSDERVDCTVTHGPRFPEKVLGQRRRVTAFSPRRGWRSGPVNDANSRNAGPAPA